MYLLFENTVCHLLGDYLEAIKKDYEKAVKIYKNNCDAFNFPKSCVKYGNYLATGKGMPKPDHEKVSCFEVLYFSLHLCFVCDTFD